MLPLLDLPFSMVASLVVVSWALNLHRRRVLGRWSNFQPLLTVFMVLLLTTCVPTILLFVVYPDTPPPEVVAGHHATFAAIYLIGLQLFLFSPYLIRGFVRDHLLQPRPRSRTQPGAPFDGREPER